MRVIIYKNNGEEDVYENVQHISNAVSFIDGKPVYTMTLNAYPKFIHIRLEDVKDYEVYHASLSVVETEYGLQCPHCMTYFDKSILDTTNQFLSFCPKCGRDVRFVLPIRTEKD